MLLAITLPVRGVMAAAMRCPPPAMAGAGHAVHGAASRTPAADPADVSGAADAEAAHAPAGHGAGAAHDRHAHADHGHASADPEQAGLHAPADPAPTAGHHHDDASGTDTCNHCSACCSMPPLAATAPSVALRHDLGLAAFPAVAAPAPDFVSGGPERPPRRG